MAGHQIQHVSSVKYLGFLLTQDLSWSRHIALICSRARKKVGFIYRSFYKSSSGPSTLTLLYKAFVRPLLEYGAIIWDPHLIKDIRALESVQRFATKICLRNWSLSYQDRLQLLDLDSLFTRRKCAKLCFLFKTVHSMVAPCFNPTFVQHDYATRRHDLCLRTQLAHTNAFFSSFYNSTVWAWNQLPANVVHSESLPAFKNSLYTCDLLPSFNF